MFSQGYIGYSSKLLEERVKKHVADANGKNKRNYTLHNAIRKYGIENLVSEVLVVGSEEYCLVVEGKLRSEKSTGWNQNVGGFKPPSPKGRKISEESIQRGVAARRKLFESETPEQRQLRSDRLKNRLVTEEWRAKMSAAASSRLPWKSSKANLNLWIDAVWLHSLATTFMELPGHVKLSTACGGKYSKHNLQCIADKFKAGWNPSEDLAWLAFKEQYLTEQEALNA